MSALYLYWIYVITGVIPGRLMNGNLLEKVKSKKPGGFTGSGPDRMALTPTIWSTSNAKSLHTCFKDFRSVQFKLDQINDRTYEQWNKGIMKKCIREIVYRSDLSISYVERDIKNASLFRLGLGSWFLPPGKDVPSPIGITRTWSHLPCLYPTDYRRS